MKFCMFVGSHYIPVKVVYPSIHKIYGEEDVVGTLSHCAMALPCYSYFCQYYICNCHYS
jgi:hypothetical protein